MFVVKIGFTEIGRVTDIVAKNPGRHPLVLTTTNTLCYVIEMKNRLSLPLAQSQRPTLKSRPLLSPIQAGGLAAVFKVLANDTRLRMLHAFVKEDEISVSSLATALGMKPQAVSNQLQRLSDLGILSSRRDGNTIYYRLIDICVQGLLEQAMCLMEETGERDGLTRKAARCCTTND